MSPPVVKFSVLTKPPSLKIKVLPKPVVQVKVVPRFPSNVYVQSPVLLDRTGGNYTISLDMSAIIANLPPGGVTSVFGRTGAVTAQSGDYTKSDVGLGNVDNTSDANKPVSSATQTALILKANIASPTFTGTPSAPTPAAGTNTTQIATTAFVTCAFRERLSANRTYYVRTDGSDSNNGLANTSGGAFLTPQKALDVVFGALDLGGFNVDIQLGAGTYTGNFITQSPQVGAGTIKIKGDTTVANTANYVLNCVTGTALTVSGFGTKLTIEGFEVNGNAGISATNGGYLSFSGYMRFGPCTSDHMRSNNGTIDTMQQPIGIAGGATSCLRASPNGYLNAFNSVISILTGTWNFSTAFALADRGSVLSCSGTTFTLTGTATGVRYNAATNGVIFTNGGGANFFPGNSAGTTATGGQYA